MSRLIDVIASHDPAIRNTPLDAIANGLSVAEMLAECEALDAFRRHSDNLYGRVRAEFFLYALHRFHIGAKTKDRPQKACPTIPFPGYVALCAAVSTKPSISFSRPNPPPAQRSHLERARRRLPRPRISNPRRPGPPQRALRPRQSMDVPHRPSRRLPASHSPRTPPPPRPEALFPILAKPPPSAWISATAAGATSFSSAWIFPKARAF